MSSNHLGLYVNFPLDEAIRLAPSDQAKAVEALAIAAKLMRAREVLPLGLLDYLADAFEAVSAQQDSEKQPEELTFHLNLTARHRRPSSVQWLEAFKLMYANQHLTKRETIKLIQKNYKVSRSHASKKYDEAWQAGLESQRVSRDEQTEEAQAVVKYPTRRAVWRAKMKARRDQIRISRVRLI